MVERVRNEIEEDIEESSMPIEVKMNERPRQEIRFEQTGSEG
jgi:hypothetical protein